MIRKKFLMTILCFVFSMFVFLVFGFENALAGGGKIEVCIDAVYIDGAGSVLCKDANENDTLASTYTISFSDNIDSDNEEAYLVDENGAYVGGDNAAFYYNPNNGNEMAQQLATVQAQSKNAIIIREVFDDGSSAVLMRYLLQEGDRTITINTEELTVRRGDGIEEQYDESFSKTDSFGDEIIDMSGYDHGSLVFTRTSGATECIKSTSDPIPSNKYGIKVTAANSAEYTVGADVGAVIGFYYYDANGQERLIGTCSETSDDFDHIKVSTEDGWAWMEFDLKSDAYKYVFDITEWHEGDNSDDTTIHTEEQHSGNSEETPDEITEQAVEDLNVNQSECQKSGAAGNLGWIVCPILEWMKGAVEGIYHDYVAPSLQVRPELFTGGNEATRTAWETFRDFANIAFIIFLLVIIFSQITGVGIDNYGIKKSLPKLIVVAVLINLSFVICQLCVDISNIVGGGIQGLFDSISPKEPVTLQLEGDGEPVDVTVQNGTAISTSLVSIGVLVGVFGVAAIIFNPAIILTFLIAALGVIIAIFFLFALLAARQAVIVVLTVLSPLAFMCYALPNLNKMFNKWLSLWKAMLLVYPICSLLVAGGNFVSSLLLSAMGDEGGFFYAFTAMVVGIIPIFFIPTVIKSAFAALGKLGVMLSGAGRLASGAATRAATNSGINKRAQQAGKERNTRIRAGLDRNGNERKLGRFGRALLGGKRSMAENRAQYMKDQEARTKADNLMGEGYEAARIRQDKKIKEEQVGDYMTLVNQETRNGEDEGRLNDLYDKYRDAGDVNGAVAVARIAARTSEGASRFMNRNVRGTDVNTMNANQAKVFGSVAKEIATGKDSGTFRATNPFAYEYAAQYNRDPSNAESYAKFMSNENSLHNVVDRHLTTTQDFVKMDRNAWKELLDSGAYDKMDPEDRAALQRLATDTMNNKGRTGVQNASNEDIYKWLANGGNGARPTFS